MAAPDVAADGEGDAPGHVVNVDGLQAVVAGTDHGHDGHGSDQRRHGGGELVARAENQRRAQDHVGQPAAHHRLLSLPFRVQVLEPRPVGGAERAHVDEPFYGAGGFGSLDHVGRALPVDGVELPRAAADHCHQVDHCGCVAAGLGQGVGVAHVSVAQIRRRGGEHALAARTAHHDAHFVVGLQQLMDHPPSQQPRGPGYQNGHNLPPGQPVISNPIAYVASITPALA